MLIVLPDSSTRLESLVFALDAEPLNSLVSQQQSAQGNIALPRFTANYGHSLADSLSSLGMSIAFCTSGMADFSGIALNACISDVDHATVVEVDENGTVAAGATVVPIGISAVPAAPFIVTMDHPFFYAIRDDDTGELLFIGALMDPNAQEVP
jgi:serine protease inhibitor